ncbi:peroxiredoxin [Nocardiopsis valliformis]|uniref:peroxiredoxin n=1 Tax=Nocardiopsis valliformis TaxID=239974 RepID=UPI00034A5DE7|nr:peroxiredoxin [Nocardiopsis valliformis]
MNSEPLRGVPLPRLSLPATIGPPVELGSEEPGDHVLFVYPKTGRPDRPAPAEWATLPGAKGCTAESCEFRDLADDFARIGFRILGLSSQEPDYQREAAERLHLPYPLLSDPDLRLAAELGLDTFEFEGERLYTRITLIVRAGVIDRAYRDISDPQKHPRAVLADLGG